MIWILAPRATAEEWARREEVTEYTVLARKALLEEVRPGDRVVEVVAGERRAPLEVVLELSMVPVTIEIVRL